MATKEILKLKAQNRSLSGFEKEKEGCWSGPFAFIQGADTQLGLIEEYIEKKTDYKWDKELALIKSAVTAINAMTPRPRFFVVCGDLIHDFPGGSFRKAQENDFIHAFKELHPDIPLVCVCGNHDVGNKPTSESVQTYTDRFGDDYFTFFCAGVMFIVINSQYFMDSSLVPDLAQKQEEWIDEQLKEAKSGKYKHVIMFQHVPWFLKDPEEEKIYFNISIEFRQKMLPKFLDANIQAIFCGHWHGNAGGFYKNLEVVVTSAVGGQLHSDKSGFRVVVVGEENIKHKYFALDDAPKNISLDGCKY